MKASQSPLWFLLCCVCSWAKRNVAPGSPASHHKPVEAHHSLHQPFDSSSVYWRFGGSTVMTSDFVRLTPSTQSREGWLWNDYPLQSQDWEVELAFKVSSDGHIGGDGFGFWVLDGSHDPSYQSDIGYLNGPIFGVRNNFKGFGVVFDSYDNDGKRDNPTIYVLKNMEGEDKPWNHDNDFEVDMVSEKPGDLAHRCTSDIRNTDNPVKAMFRFVDETLHVYIDTSQAKDTKTKKGKSRAYGRSKTANGYRFCLAVNIGESFNNTAHMAFTAHTGQVADKHDLVSITTRYLDDADAQIDDYELFRNAGDYYYEGGTSRWTWIFWFLVVVTGIGLTVESLYELSSVRSLKADQINPVYLCEKLNQMIIPHYGVHFTLTLLFLISGCWIPFFVNLPLAAFRLFQIVRNSYRLQPQQFDAPGDDTYTMVLYVSVVVYGLMAIYYFYNLASL